MARPKKAGIDYFPLDVDFLSDHKIRVLKSRFGADGILLYLYILCEAYRSDGYFLKADDDFQYLAAEDLNIPPEKIGLMLNFLLNRSLLDSTLFSTDKVLTSHGIQTRYQIAVKTRAVKGEVLVDERLWLLNEEETESFIKVRQFESFSEKNPSFSEKNESFSKEKSLKESKVKESKVKDSIYVNRQSRFTPPSVGEVRAYCQERGNQVDPQRFVDFYESKGWMIGKNKMKDWKSAVRTWERNNSGSYNSGSNKAKRPTSYDLSELERMIDHNELSE